jgi:hypothetical protein
VTQNADSWALMDWVLSVRRKFSLRDDGPQRSDYWDGYKSCLDDVDRLAAKWAASLNDRSGAE